MSTPGAELATFGSLMAYAAGLEADLAAHYAALAGRDGPAQALYRRLHESYAKRQQQVARVRRENVNEMILEPISGLHAIDHRAGLVGGEPVPARLAALEEAIAGFYDTAADKGRAVLAEVAHTFLRLAKGNRDHRAWLAAG